MNSNDNNVGIMKIAANILFYWGAVTTVLILIGLLAGTDTDSIGNLLSGTFFIGILPMGIGLYLKMKVKKKLEGKDALHEKKKYAIKEKKVIMAAIDNSGILTLSKAALGLGSSLDDTKKFMETLVTKGYCIIDVNDKGVIEYRFPEYTED